LNNIWPSEPLEILTIWISDLSESTGSIIWLILAVENWRLNNQDFEPTEPTAPTEPSGPSETSEPSEPSGPSEPWEPFEPSKPFEAFQASLAIPAFQFLVLSVDWLGHYCSVLQCWYILLFTCGIYKFFLIILSESSTFLHMFILRFSKSSNNFKCSWVNFLCLLKLNTIAFYLNCLISYFLWSNIFIIVIRFFNVLFLLKLWKHSKLTFLSLS
jgi:hypothetical protein